MQAIRCRHCLHPRPFARLLISLLLGGWLFSPVCLPGADSGYEQQLTKARALAKENSWALAREVYAAALPLAPDADHHRWCEFWLADATWRSEGQPGWAQRENWLKLHLATYDALAQPYTTGIPRDHFWMELQSSRADLREVMQIPDHWRDRAEIADYLASQPPSEEAAQGYVAFLQKTLARPAARNQNNKTILPLVPHLANGSRVGASIEDRAWCAWQAAHFMQTEEIKATELPDRLKARAERWAAVRTLAHGTRWETVVRAEDFIWRARMGWSPDAAPGTPANIPTLLAGIKEIHAAFAQEEKTDQNHQFDQELSQLEKEQGEPRLNLVMDTQFLPAAPVGFAYATAGFGRLSLSLKLLDPADWSPESATYATLPNPREGTVIREWTIDFPQSAQRVWQSELVELGSSLKPGFYSLTARGEQPVSSGEIIQYHPFIVSGIRGLSVTRSNGGGELLVYSMTDGRPVTGSAAKGIATSARQKRNASWHGTTDQEGRIALPQISASDFKLVGLIGGQPLWFRSNAGNDTREDISADVFLDRPLYRPGETVHWKIIVRERGNGRFVVPTNDRPLRLSIILDDEPLLKESTLTLNAFGTAHGEIQIPETARPGRAHLILTRADDKEPTEVAVEHGLFQVDNFVPPAVVAKIELASGGASLHPGREIVVRVNVAYFSGGPVVNAPVECHFAASPSDYRNEEIEAFQAWRKTVSANPLKSTTSVSGFAEFRLQIPAEISAGNISLECEAAVLPEGARPAHASRQFTISGLGLLIDPAGWIKPRLARPGEEILFEAVVRDGTGAPAHFEGVAQLVERQWLETWLGPQGQILNGAEYREVGRKEILERNPKFSGWRPVNRYLPGWKNLHTGYHEIALAVKPIRTGADGRVNAAFVLPHAGLFQVKLLLDGEPLPLDKDQSEGTSGYSPFEGMGTERWAPFSAVAIDERLSPLQLTPENEAVIFPAHIESDKAFDVVCVVPEEATQAWLTISGEETTVTNPVELHGRVAHCNIDHPPGFMGVGLARLSYVFPDGSGQSCMHPFKVDHSSLDLNVTIAPVDRVQRPGAEAELEFTTKDHLGRPKRAELALAVADDAVVQLAGPKQEKVSPVFCETSRTTSAETLNFGRISSITLERIRDPRPGILLNTMGGYSDEETILLSPFMVEASDDVGYYATSTLAGTRVRTELKDVGSSISVVTRQFLQDTGTGNSADLLVYTPKTEVAGLSGHSGGAPAKPIEIRRHFSSTAHWDPEIITDKNGRARVKFKYPDNLTQWRIDAYAVGEDGNTFGGAGTLTQTSLPLQARLQLPRFLVAGDTAVASAALVNRVDHDLIADVQLKASGVIGIDPAQAAQTGLVVPKQAEARAAWTIHAPQAGKAELGLLARAGAEGDAMILPLPIMEDGIQQQTAATGRLAEDGKTCVLSLLLPETLDRERTKVTLELSPSYAATMLDALPYLVDYPYGCVEQTMNRFLPAVIVRKTLVDMGLNLDEVEKRILARETAPDATRRQKSAGLGRLDDVVKLSLSRLDEAQHYKGGFGWWPGAIQTDLWMTAYVVWGLDLAETAGLELPDKLLEQSTDALISSLIEITDQSDVRAFALATLARHPGIKKSGHYKALGEVFARAYENRDKISPSGRACLTLAVSTFGTSGQRDILLRNLENGALRVSGSDRGDTVHWGATGGYWRAMDSTVETTALTAFALLELEPKHPLIEPAVNWLLLNRRSSHWASTRDTAFTVLALNRYVQQRNELKGESEIEVLVNGATVQRVKLTRESLLEGPLALSLPAAMLRAGGNTVELRRTGGRGPVYAVVLGSAWARSDDVNPVANLIGVARSFVRNAAQPTLVGTLRIVPEPLPSGGSAMVGEEVSAHIILTVPNDLEYVMVAVPKPAGCEPLNPLSGWDARIQRTGEASAPGSSVPAEKEPARPVYREERDDKSVFFLDRLAAGTWEIKFGLRAVTVGDFRALPVQATAMYVPEVSANSEARRMKIESTDSGGKNSQR